MKVLEFSRRNESREKLRLLRISGRNKIEIKEKEY